MENVYRVENKKIGNKMHIVFAECCVTMLEGILKVFCY